MRKKGEIIVTQHARWLPVEKHIYISDKKANCEAKFTLQANESDGFSGRACLATCGCKLCTVIESVVSPMREEEVKSSVEYREECLFRRIFSNMCVICNYYLLIRITMKKSILIDQLTIKNATNNQNPFKHNNGLCKCYIPC